jgi:hypothetical protein
MWQARQASFSDFLDAINPLQHIPVISTMYRQLTGDDMGYMSRIAGDTLYGGIFGSIISGLVSSLANVLVDAATGKDIPEHVMAAVALEPAPAMEQHAAFSPTKGFREPVAEEQKPARQTLPDPHIEMAAHDPLRIQAAINQYKWQMFADPPGLRSNFWG